jgi:hypothetical protein
MTEENQNAIVDELHALNLNLQELIKVLKTNKELSIPSKGDISPTLQRDMDILTRYWKEGK